MDILNFYSLSEEPYSYLKINPRFFFNAPQYTYAKAILNDGIKNKSAHLYLTGPVGSGKTTLLKVLETDLASDKNNLVFFTFAPRGIRSSHSFLKRLCREMEIKTERSYVELLENFESQIGTWARENKTVILLIDEAHKLNTPALDFLHHLMNFVTAKKLLIVIVLAGQDLLSVKIGRRKELRSRMQAVTLNPLKEKDATELIKWRWQVASSEKDNPLPFTEDALHEVFEITRGLPRDMCSLCHRCLLSAVALDTKTINKELVVEAAKTLKFYK